MTQINTNNESDLPFSSNMGFTLVELLVAVSIIALLIGITFPFVSKLQSGSRVSVGVNTLAVATETARRFAIESPAPIEEPLLDEDAFSGAAAIFCPSGEIRIASNVLNAKYGSGANDYCETNSPATWNAFEDVPDLDYISIPGRVRYLGIVREDASADGVRFIDPPFAIRFDSRGSLAIGNSMSQSRSNPTANRLVFYDHNHDGFYEFAPQPASSGDPRRTNAGDWYEWEYFYSMDEDATPGDPSGFGDPGPWWDEDRQRHQLPYGTLVAVIGVRVVNVQDPKDFQDVYFSRYTGAPVRESSAP